MRYCGRDFPPEEMALIRRLIADDPGRTRAELSRLLCTEIEWYKADGGLKDMSARVAMLRMQDDGLIRLPTPTCARPQSRLRSTPATDPGAPIDQPVHALPPLQRVPVVKRTQSRLWVDICSTFAPAMFYYGASMHLSCNIDILHIPVDQRIHPPLSLPWLQDPARGAVALLRYCR